MKSNEFNPKRMLWSMVDKEDIAVEEKTIQQLSEIPNCVLPPRLLEVLRFCFRAGMAWANLKRKD